MPIQKRNKARLCKQRGVSEDEGQQFDGYDNKQTRNFVAFNVKVNANIEVNVSENEE